MGCGASAGLIAAGVGAVGSIGGALISGSAAQSAANTQAAAANQASQNALAQYGQERSDLIPYNTYGQEAETWLMGSLGLGPNYNLLAQNGINGLTFQPTQAQLSATPGYQFDLSQGLQAVQNSNAAQGLGVSGSALKGAANYATGLANNTLTTQQGIFQQNLGNVLNPLQSLANLGENAAATTGALGNQAVANSNALQVGAANASAAGTVGAANAASGALGSLGGAPLNYALYNQLLGGGGAGGATDTGSF